MDLKTKLGLLGAGAGMVAVTVLTSAPALARTYNDVPSSHWAYNAVQWVSQYGIMTGPGNQPGLFNAAGFANRAEIATVLHRFFNLLEKDISDVQVRLNLLEQRVSQLEGRSGSSSSRSSVAGTITSFMATLNGSQEVPSVSTSANGAGTFNWSDRNSALTYDITVQNLSSPIIAAHFHTGAPGVAGPAIKDITFSGNRATGTWADLTSQQRIDLFAGRLYVNVHTSTHPDGEIRGQVVLTGSSSSSSSRSSSVNSSVSSSVSSVSSASSASSVSSGMSSSSSSVSSS